MSKYIQPISHYPQHERIKAFLLKKKPKQSNLTETSAGFTYLGSLQINNVTYFWCICSPSHYWAGAFAARVTIGQC